MSVVDKRWSVSMKHRLQEKRNSCFTSLIRTLYLLSFLLWYHKPYERSIMTRKVMKSALHSSNERYFYVLLFNFLKDPNSFCGATDTFVLDFWLCFLWAWKPDRQPFSHKLFFLLLFSNSQNINFKESWILIKIRTFLDQLEFSLLLKISPTFQWDVVN